MSTEPKSKMFEDSAITIKDVGPNAHITIPVPPDGGVVVLRGRNDTGKTEALRAIESLAGGKQRLSVRDGAPRGTKGRVVGGGVSLTVSASTRRKGEAEFEVLEGRLSIKDLVDPQIKSPEAADARRIKALVSLAGVGDPEQLFGPAIEGIEYGADENVVEIAARIKRAREIEARKEEAMAAEFGAKAKGLISSAGPIDPEVGRQLDPDVLQASLEEAMTEVASLTQRAKDAEEARARAKVAQSTLDKLGESSGAAEAAAALDKAEQAEADTRAKYQRIATELATAEAEVEAARQMVMTSRREHAAAESRAKDIEAAKQELDADQPDTVPESEVNAAQTAVTDAREAIEVAAVARKAKEDRTAAQDLRHRAREFAERAERFRDEAKSVDGALSSVVGKLGTPLAVRDGRLVLLSDGREKTFAELSQGARWRLALDVAIEAVGQGGLLPIAQSAWESLDFQNRQAIVEHVTGRNVTVITAEASRSPADDRGRVFAEQIGVAK